MQKNPALHRTAYRRPASRAVAAFILSLVVCGLLCGLALRHRCNLQQTTLERVINDKSDKIRDVLTRLFYKTQVLSTLVIKNNGEVVDFERVAAIVVDDPAILNVLVAPNGRVSHVYPLERNRGVIGYNLLGPGAGNKEAILAREKRQLVFGGPFELVQGGRALVGRLPVFLNAPGRDRSFWGLVSVTLKYPEALASAELETLRHDGMAFEIWRINPDDNKRQVIAASDYGYSKKAAYREERIQILNAEWYFRLIPVRAWYEDPTSWALLAAAFGLSLLAGLLVQNNCELRRGKASLERMLRTDVLTGALNRAGLIAELEQLILRKSKFRIHCFDLNHFKWINENYGYGAGDEILLQFSNRIQRHLDENSLLARINGDEFVVVQSGSLLYKIKNERLENGLVQEMAFPFVAGDSRIGMHFSAGSADYPKDGMTIDELICLAEKRMNASKQERYIQERKIIRTFWEPDAEGSDGGEARLAR